MAYWVEEAKKAGTLAPQPKKENEKEKGQTVSYDELVKSWADTNAAAPAATPVSAPAK
jgi:glycerol transport system substrate-binding protein